MQPPDNLREPFTSDEWLYELKFDGYRVMAGIEGVSTLPSTQGKSISRVQLRTKSGADCIRWFPEVAEALQKIPSGPHIAVVDQQVEGAQGYLIAAGIPAPPPGSGLEAGEIAHPLLIQHASLAVDASRSWACRWLSARPCSSSCWPAWTRTACCSWATYQPMPSCSGPWWRLAIEGVVAKRRASIYRPGVRSEDWCKVKRPGWQEGRIWRS